jgi:hypothetical protein
MVHSQHRQPRMSLNGAQRAQPVATGGKCHGAKNGSDTRKPLPWVCDQLLRRSHGKEVVGGSSSPGALQSPCKSASFSSESLHDFQCGRYGALLEPSGSELGRKRRKWAHSPEGDSDSAATAPRLGLRRGAGVRLASGAVQCIAQHRDGVNDRGGRCACVAEGVEHYEVVRDPVVADGRDRSALQRGGVPRRPRSRRGARRPRRRSGTSVRPASCSSLAERRGVRLPVSRVGAGTGDRAMAIGYALRGRRRKR